MKTRKEILCSHGNIVIETCARCKKEGIRYAGPPQTPGRRLSKGEEFARRIMGDENPAMQPNPQHTPTPWKVRKMHKHLAIESEFRRIAEVGMIGGPDGFSSELDAAFIVRAVNVHEALVANLQLLLGYESMKTFWEDNKGFKIIVEQAIAKAEAKS